MTRRIRVAPRDLWPGYDLDRPSTPVRLNPGDMVVAGYRMIYAAARDILDLSGAAQSNVVILHTTRALTVVKLIALYTEASSADAGVTIKVGKESDDDYYYTGTSIVSKSLWDEDDLTLLNADVAAGDTMVCSSAGGKTGTGEILFHIECTVD